MSARGLVSRVTPVQTALRNCTGDEGRSFGFGDQVADPKPPQAALVKSQGGERCGNVGTMIPAGTVERGERKPDSEEAAVMVVERRGRVIDDESGQLATGGARSSTEGGSLHAMARAV